MPISISTINSSPELFLEFIELKKLDKQIIVRSLQAIEDLAANPYPVDNSDRDLLARE